MRAALDQDAGGQYEVDCSITQPGLKRNDFACQRKSLVQ